MAHLLTCSAEELRKKIPDFDDQTILEILLVHIEIKIHVSGGGWATSVRLVLTVPRMWLDSGLGTVSWTSAERSTCPSAAPVV